MRTLLAATALLVVATLAPAVGAHGAPEPLDVATRLLADATDDCGGDGGAATGNCRGSEDLIALDVQEAWDASLGENVLQVKLWMDKGKSYPITDTLTFDSPAGIKTLAMQTTNDAHFANAGGFDSVGDAQPLSPADGTRFTVTGVAKLSTLGLKVGDRISGFKVESKVGANVGDYMPGLCHNAIGECVQPPGADTTTFTKPNYVLRGPVQYISLSAPTGTTQVPLDGDAGILQLQLGNLLTKSVQTVTLTLAGADGVDAGFHVGDNAGGAPYAPQTDLTVAAKSGTIVHLRLHGTQAGARGSLTVTATTDLGGRDKVQLPYEVVAGAIPTDTSSSGWPHGDTTSKGSPPPLAPFLGIVLLVLARRRA